MLAHYMAGDPRAPLVVLVHGVTGSATTWAELIEHLATRYYVAAVDMLGHGLSPRYSESELFSPGDAGAAAFEETLEYLVHTHNAQAYASQERDVRGAIAVGSERSLHEEPAGQGSSTPTPSCDAHVHAPECSIPERSSWERVTPGIQAHRTKAILIGHSMGGSVVASVASRRPDLVSGIILEDPAWNSPEQEAEYRTHTDEYLSYAKRVWLGNPVATVTQNVEERGLRTPDFDQPGSDGSHGWTAADHHGWAFAKPLVDLNLIASGVTSVSQPWQEIAQALTVPTVVITSNGSEIVVGKRGAAEIAALGNPYISVEFIDGVGHNIRHSAPSEYVAIVDRYLTQWQPQ